MPAPSPEQNGNGVSIANWPTADIALPTDTTTNAANASTPPFSVAPFPVGPDALPAKPIHIPASALPQIEKVELETPEQSPAFKYGVTIAFAVVGLLVVGLGVFGWKYFAGKKSPAAKNPATVSAEAVVPDSVAVSVDPSASAPDPIPEAAVTPRPEPAPISLPKQETPKADVESPRPTPAASVPGTPNVSSEPSNPSSPISSNVAPGVTANAGGGAATVGASPEFRAFIASVKISGVFQGASSRAFINGRMTRLGEVVDARLGVIFEGIDVEKKQIIFKDASGAVATRRY